MKCPQCHLQLQEVIQPECPLILSKYNMIRAGDYYCINCKPDIEGLKYKYFWKKDLK
jgi:hypothetical protein